MNDPMIVLALQGGGALGAYQAGVYEGLFAHHLRPDWVLGTSIGAFNGAIIAGNPPEKRLERLHAFWEGLARDELPALPAFGELLRPWVNSAAMMDILLRGVPGFFTPRAGMLLDPNAHTRPRDASFYDTSPLAATLQSLIDFDYLNAAEVRYTCGAVKIAGGEQVMFDNTRDTLTVRHIMASGALPPGFPPVEIDGEAYWDGGVYSNTPIDVVLEDDERRDMLCFAVDLWQPSAHVPESITEVLTQEKSIRFASRSKEHLADHELIQNLRHAVRLLSEHLTPAAKTIGEVREAADLGCGARINVVRLVMKAGADDDYLRDVDFRRDTLRSRWAGGLADCGRVCRLRSWLRPLPPGIGLAVHELPAA